MRNRGRRAFTLVELLVVIAIIGILVMLMLPAVQSAREAARRMQCQNHLKQMGLGWHNHHSGLNCLPSGGWGWTWLGEPDRGTGKAQPGGWVFNTLPYVEQQNLRDLGKGQTGANFTNAVKLRAQTAVSFFNCPSRRAPKAYKDGSGYNTSQGSVSPGVSGRTDYAANCGNQGRNELWGGPGSLAAGDTDTGWPDASGETGVCFQKSEISFSDISDGTTNTFMIGEKYLPPENYTTGADAADNENMYVGYDNDLYRSTNSGYGLPAQDRAGVVNKQSWGSAHASGFNMCMCDGSIRNISYTIDMTLFSLLGHRADGQVVNQAGF
jgi:prepilin-type N-terminal cleavage/methylation domain-containing protein